MSDFKIAVVQAMNGHLTCVGPNDYKESEFSSAMDAAISWHIEAGWLPAACYWIHAKVPPAPSIPELRAQVGNGSFPKQFLEDMEVGHDPA